MTNYVRATLEISPDIIKEMDQLQKRFQLDDHGQVLQKALQLLTCLKDKRIFFEDHDGTHVELDIYPPEEEDA